VIRTLVLSLLVAGAASSAPKQLVDTIKRIPGVHWRPRTAIVGNFTYEGRADVAVVGLTGKTAVVALATEVHPGVVKTSKLPLEGLCSPAEVTLRAGTPEYKPEPCPEESEICERVRRENAAMKLATERGGQVIWLDDPGCDGAALFWDGERLAVQEYSP
jgi:hypothetical protein